MLISSGMNKKAMTLRLLFALNVGKESAKLSQHIPSLFKVFFVDSLLLRSSILVQKSLFLVSKLALVRKDMSSFRVNPSQVMLLSHFELGGNLRKKVMSRRK
jgi:hypothetical protein